MRHGAGHLATSCQMPDRSEGQWPSSHQGAARAARDQHLEGSGLYRLNIKPDGTVASVTVLKSTGHGLSDDAAVDAFRQWRFRPGALHALKLPINFTLKGVTY